MDLIEKYLGEGEEEEKIDEVLGRGMAHVIKVKDKKALIKMLKKRNIKYTKTGSGDIAVGDDDFDEVEEYMARMEIE